MKFTDTRFEEYTELNRGGETYEFEPKNLYKLPLHIAEKLANHGDAEVSYEGAYDVDGEEVADRFGELEKEVEEEEEEDGESASEAYQWLDEKTVSEVEEDIGDVGDELLKDIAEEAERKGALEAIEEELEQR